MADLEGILQQLREERRQTQAQLQRLGAAISALGGGETQRKTRRRKISVAARKRIADAQRRRWAKVRVAASGKARKGKRTLSPEARQKIIAAQKARWARFRAGKKH